MKKVKPLPQEDSATGFEHVSGCFRYFSVFLSKVLFLIGLIPIEVGKKTKTLEFKLASRSSFFAFVRLLVFTFPFLVLPFILELFGLFEEEYKRVTGKDFDQAKMSAKGLDLLHQAEYYMNSLIFVLPFAFPFASIGHFNKWIDIQIAFQNALIMEGKNNHVSVKNVIFPLLGIGLFAIGKLLSLILNLVKWYVPGLYFNLYASACYRFLAHLPLHSLLAVYENYLYQYFDMFHSMCAWTLNADQDCLLERAQMLPDSMEGVQGGYGLFILVDICLMLLYWLLHTYHAYFTFQVTTDIILIECKRWTINITTSTGGPLPCCSFNLDHIC